MQNEVTRMAEQCVIGSILIDENVLVNVIDDLKPDHFYFDDLKNVFETILELSSEGKTIDFVSVMEKLVSKSESNEVDLKKLLLNCAELVPSVRKIKEYSKTVKDSFKSRKLQELATNLTLNGIYSENVDETADRFMEQLHEIVSENHKKRLQNVGDVGLRVFDSYNSENKNLENRSQTGFTRLDKILKGMSSGNLIILAARPKVGKTAFALSIAENVAQTGKTVAFFSLEMEATEVFERLLAKRSRVSMNTLIDKSFDNVEPSQKISSEEILRISETIDNTYNLPIKINDNPSSTVNSIRLECRNVKNLGLIVIDYLQLLRSTKNYENRNLEIGAICRELKCLASELGVPVLCLSQLNRSSSELSRPSPSELRDSGSIEQDANKVILMWCVEKNLDERGFIKSKTIGVDVALNRRGNSGVTLFNFDGNYMKFEELDTKYEDLQIKRSWK